MSTEYEAANNDAETDHDAGSRSLERVSGDVRSATRVAKLLHRIAADELERFENGRLFPFPFFVEEKLLDKLNAYIIERLSAIVPDQDVSFTSVTRFQDLSSVKFDSFNNFIDKAGDRKDPESARLSWSKFLIDANAEPVLGEVRVDFITEKRLFIQDSPPGDTAHAFIKLTVSGSNHEWVELTFSHLVPIIEASKLGGIYRPLWLFRNEFFINILAHVLAWIGFITGSRIASRSFSKETVISRDESLSQILATDNIVAKFDIFATQILSPSSSPWWEPIVIIGAGGVAFAIIFVTGTSLFPKLTPNSSVAIGLSNNRAQKYMNTFKFVVFTIIVSGILVPIFLQMLNYVLSQ